MSAKLTSAVFHRKQDIYAPARSCVLLLVQPWLQIFHVPSNPTGGNLSRSSGAGRLCTDTLRRRRLPG
jgi:hypothetical protein